MGYGSLPGHRDMCPCAECDGRGRAAVPNRTEPVVMPPFGTVADPTPPARFAFSVDGWDLIGRTDDGLDVWQYPNPPATLLERVLGWWGG